MISRRVRLPWRWKMGFCPCRWGRRAYVRRRRHWFLLRWPERERVPFGISFRMGCGGESQLQLKILLGVKRSEPVRSLR